MVHSGVDGSVVGFRSRGVEEKTGMWSTEWMVWCGDVLLAALWWGSGLLPGLCGVGCVGVGVGEALGWAGILSAVVWLCVGGGCL